MTVNKRIPTLLHSFKNELTMTNTRLKDSLLIIQGALIQAAGYTIFLIPNKIIPGGLYGIGTVLYHLWAVPVGTAVLVMNVPLLIWGIRTLGARFGIRTVAGIILTAAFTDIIIYLFGIPTLTDDLMVQAIIGGILVGYGVSLIFKTGATTGGVEIVGQILNTKYKLSIGRSILLMNVVIITAGVFFLGDPSMVIYSIVSVYAISKMMDASLEGVSYYKGLIIVSKKHEEIKERVLQAIRRDIYYINEGDVSNNRLLFTALSRREAAFLKEYVKSIDEEASVIIFNAQEYIGTGMVNE
jgi:uncharacterized membrane-anchored protein YitT (DUF2179 family)